MEKPLDRKIARILSDRSCEDFIVADAKGGDVASGLAAPRPQPGAPCPRGPLPNAGRVPPTAAQLAQSSIILPFGSGQSRIRLCHPR